MKIRIDRLKIKYSNMNKISPDLRERYIQKSKSKLVKYKFTDKVFHHSQKDKKNLAQRFIYIYIYNNESK